MEMNKEEKEALGVVLEALAPERERRLNEGIKRIYDRLDIMMVMMGKMNQRQMDQDRTIKELEVGVRMRDGYYKQLIDKYEQILQKIKFVDIIHGMKKAANNVKKAKPINILNKRISEVLNLSTFSTNRLKGDNIIFIKDLVKLRPGELYKVPKLGRKSHKEITEQLAVHGLSLSETLND